MITMIPLFFRAWICHIPILYRYDPHLWEWIDFR